MAHRDRGAFTIVELLVTVAIVCLIAAIALPAVMSARETARRQKCTNNLRQIALAINGHLEQKSYYPREENGYSAFVIMLPFLDQSPLFDSINLSKPLNPPTTSDVNYTALTTNLAVFSCPSESLTTAIKLGPVTYAGNLGTGVGPHGRPENGPFASSSLDPKIHDALVRDGLANTIAVSEFRRTLGRIAAANVHPIFQLGDYQKGQFEVMIQDCRRAVVGRVAGSPIPRGTCWAFVGLNETVYDHNLPPNRNACTSGGETAGAWTAGGDHSSGVNCAHLDGHVSFVKDSTSSPVWRSLGTMNGGEVTNSN